MNSTQPIRCNLLVSLCMHHINNSTLLLFHTGVCLTFGIVVQKVLPTNTAKSHAIITLKNKIQRCTVHRIHKPTLAVNFACSCNWKVRGFSVWNFFGSLENWSNFAGIKHWINIQVAILNECCARSLSSSSPKGSKENWTIKQRGWLLLLTIVSYGHRFMWKTNSIG